jgi:amidohydrolase
MRDVLERVAGKGKLVTNNLSTGSEDFSFFQKEVPGVFFFLGVTPEGQDPAKAAANHSPLFIVDDAALKTGVCAMAQVAAEYLARN